MLSEDLVREIVALRRRVERLEAQEPVAGALRGANAEIDAQGNATLAGGLNVGTATGAAAGDASIEGTLTAAAITGLACPYQSELTLNSSGAITVGNGTFYRIDTYGDAANDDLVTISGGSDGQIIVLRTAVNARDVIIKHATGNVYCGADFTLDRTADRIVLQYDNAIPGWCCIGKWDNLPNV